MKMDEQLSSPEGKTLEFKRNLSSPKPILKTLTAFANTAGGTLLVGVADDRSVCGLSDPLGEEERLASWISDGITPRLVPDIEVISWRKKQLLAVRVYPSALRPHWICSEGMPGGVYVRVGSTNRKADTALMEAMRRHVTGVSYDENPLPELNTEALDFRAASVLIGRKEPVTLQEGLTLRLLARVQNRTVPTVGGLLLFGQNVQAHFPDVRMQCARFSGITKSVIADRAELQGALPALLDGALEFVRKHALLGMQIDGLRREDRWSVPMNAVREALVNAVVHADYAITGRPLRLAIYDDRMEIENPGILPMGMTMDDLLNGVSMLRNRVIGRVFLEAGMVEQWGSGVQRMTDECRSYGLQAPWFEELGFGFRVTIGLIPASKVAGAGDSMSKRIIEMVEKSAAGVSTGEIASVTGLSTRAVRARMADLLARGQVVVLGTGPRDPNRRYHPVKRVFAVEK